MVHQEKKQGTYVYDYKFYMFTTEMTCWPIQVARGSKAINPRAWPGSTQT
jgi:hypothetical protein